MRCAALKLHGEHDYRNLCKMDVANGVTNFTRKILNTQIDLLQNRYRGRLNVIGRMYAIDNLKIFILPTGPVKFGVGFPEQTSRGPTLWTMANFTHCARNWNSKF